MMCQGSSSAVTSAPLWAGPGLTMRTASVGADVTGICTFHWFLWEPVLEHQAEHHRMYSLFLNRIQDGAVSEHTVMNMVHTPFVFFPRAFWTPCLEEMAEWLGECSREAKTVTKEQRIWGGDVLFVLSWSDEKNDSELLSLLIKRRRTGGVAHTRPLI